MTTVTDPIVTHLAQEILRTTTAGTQTHRLACLLLEHQQHLTRIDEAINGKPALEKRAAPPSGKPLPTAVANKDSEQPPRPHKDSERALRPTKLSPDMITGLEIMAELNTNRRVMSRIGQKGLLKKAGTFWGGGFYTRQNYEDNLEAIRHLVKLDEVEQSGHGINKGYGGEMVES